MTVPKSYIHGLEAEVEKLRGQVVEEVGVSQEEFDGMRNSFMKAAEIVGSEIHQSLAIAERVLGEPFEGDLVKAALSMEAEITRLKANANTLQGNCIELEAKTEKLEKERSAMKEGTKPSVGLLGGLGLASAEVDSEKKEEDGADSEKEEDEK